MKEILAFVQSDRLSAVVGAIEHEGAGGVTVLQAKGRGKGDRPVIGGQRGTSKHVAEYSSLDAVFVVVDDAKADAVTTAITNAASTGSKGDGKIFVSTVDEAIDIGSKKKGAEAL